MTRIRCAIYLKSVDVEDAETKREIKRIIANVKDAAEESEIVLDVESVVDHVRGQD